MSNKPTFVCFVASTHDTKQLVGWFRLISCLCQRLSNFYKLREQKRIFADILQVEGAKACFAELKGYKITSLKQNVLLLLAQA
jgi:hypothetical protein